MRALKSLEKYLVENPMQELMLQYAKKVSPDLDIAAQKELMPKSYLIPDDSLDFLVLCSSSLGWEHVSVSLRDKKGDPIDRCPYWEEMCKIKALFFEDDECVM